MRFGIACGRIIPCTASCGRRTVGAIGALPMPNIRTWGRRWGGGMRRACGGGGLGGGGVGGAGGGGGGGGGGGVFFFFFFFRPPQRLGTPRRAAVCVRSPVRHAT